MEAGAKLDRSEVLALQPDRTTCYFVKLWRLWQPVPKLVWQGETKLHIQRFVDKKRGDHLSLIVPVSRNWAECSYQDVEDDGSVVAEDYMMEIFHLPAN